MSAVWRIERVDKGAACDEALFPVLEALEFSPLQYLALFGYDTAASEVQRRRFLRRLEQPGDHFVAQSGDEVVGACSRLDLDDLSGHFGIRFSEVAIRASSGLLPVERQRLMAELLESALRAVSGVVLLRIEGSDRCGFWAAQEAGFMLMETTLTFVNDLNRAHMNADVDLTACRHHVFRDGPLGPDVEINNIRAGALQLTEDHYHVDPGLPDQACDALWLRNFDRGISGETADVVVLAHQGEDLVGLGIWKHWSEFEEYGLSILGDGFGFRSYKYGGGNESFPAYVCNTNLLGNRLLEWSTQATNFPMINMISSQRSIRHCRTSYMFHKWADA